MIFWPKLLTVAHAFTTSVHPFLPLYYYHMLKFDLQTISILTACAMLLRVPASAFWADLVDRNPALHGVFTGLLTAVGTAGVLVALSVPPTWSVLILPAAIVSCIFDGLFYQPLEVLIDSAIIKILGDYKILYESQRQWGKVASGLMAVGIGFFLDNDHDYDTLMVTILIGSVVLFLLSLSTNVQAADPGLLGIAASVDEEGDMDETLPLVKHHNGLLPTGGDMASATAALPYTFYKPYSLFGEQLSHISEEDASMLQRVATTNSTTIRPIQRPASVNSTCSMCPSVATIPGVTTTATVKAQSIDEYSEPSFLYSIPYHYTNSTPSLRHTPHINYNTTSILNSINNNSSGNNNNNININTNINTNNNTNNNNTSSNNINSNYNNYNNTRSNSNNNNDNKNDSSHTNKATTVSSNLPSLYHQQPNHQHHHSHHRQEQQQRHNYHYQTNSLLLEGSPPSFELARLPFPPQGSPIVVLIMLLPGYCPYVRTVTAPPPEEESMYLQYLTSQQSKWTHKSFIFSVFCLGIVYGMTQTLSYIYLHDVLLLPMHFVGFIGLIMIVANILANRWVTWIIQKIQLSVIISGAHIVLILCAFAYTWLQPSVLSTKASVIILQTLQGVCFPLIWLLAAHQVNSVILTGYKRMVLKGMMAALFSSIGPALGVALTGYLAEHNSGQYLDGYRLVYKYAAGFTILSAFLSWEWSNTD